MKRNDFLTASLFIALLSWNIAEAGENLSPKALEALKKTQEMLKDPAKRNEEIKSNVAKKTDQKVKELAGSAENTEAIYKLAADVFGDLMEKNGGNIDQVTKMLDKGKEDPEWFAKQWTPEQLEQLRKLAEQIQHTLPTN